MVSFEIYLLVSRIPLLTSSFCALIILFGCLCPQLTGHVADLSLKGSPYWMAPEVYTKFITLYYSTMSHAFSIDTYFSHSFFKRVCKKITALT